MHKSSSHGVYTAFFHIPSFYGAIAWGAWLILYLLKLIRLDEVSSLALIIFIAVELLFMLSTFLAYPRYRDLLQGDMAAPVCKAGRVVFPGKMLLIVLHGLGLLGLMKYLIDIANYFGGINYVLFALMNEAASIRGDVDLPTSMGTQLTYFGWIAIGFTIFGITNKRLSKWWIFLVVMQFVGNLVYIDRTRPIWIMFTALLMILPATERLDTKKILKWMMAAFMTFIILFWVGAEWAGKTYYEGKFDDPAIPGITQVMYAYGVSGFAYFNHMIVNNEPISYKSERTLYPLLKFLSKFGLTKEPPSPILEFYDVPFETNVGTFLEPFYRDGGFLFVLFGVLIYSFGFDLLALKLLASNDPFAFFVWSNLCFTTLIAFFTPKITQFPIWLFIGLSLISLLIKQVHTIIIYSEKKYD